APLDRNPGLVNEHPARVRLIEAGHDSEQSRLAHAGGAEQSDHLSLLNAGPHDVADLCVDIAQDGRVTERDRYSLNLEENLLLLVCQRSHLFPLQGEVRIGAADSPQDPYRVILKETDEDEDDGHADNKERGLELGAVCHQEREDKRESDQTEEPAFRHGGYDWPEHGNHGQVGEQQRYQRGPAERDKVGLETGDKLRPQSL